MKFLDRHDELGRLDRLARGRGGGLAVVYGRRRIGKTRLLVEWCRRNDGTYVVADQSAADIQRRYLAQTLSARLPGFADVDYPDWSALLARLAREARQIGWRGPIVFDELPYWVASSPEIASVLQRWIDHDASEAGLIVAIAGSSQRMMQGLALARDAPLYGRARELFEITALEPSYIRDAIGPRSAREQLEFHAAWGGVPRYWELASEVQGSVQSSIDELVLDPRGPLHREPDRLLLEESPSALEVRPLLDAIGAGAHRVSEIAARMGRPATSLSRPLERLIELGMTVRETPFGEPERRSRRSLYRIAEPFTRLWFRVVAPHRGELVSGTRKTRLAVLARYWDALIAAAWEQLCRDRLPMLAGRSRVAKAGPWKPGARWWRGNAPEWDVVAEAVEQRRLLLGEVRLGSGPMTRARLRRVVSEVESRPPPELPARYRAHEVMRALFLPAPPPNLEPGETGTVQLVTFADLVAR